MKGSTPIANLRFYCTKPVSDLLRNGYMKSMEYLILLALLSMAIGLETGHFMKHAIFYLSIPATRDADVYFAMGHAMLNGLAPYRDVFEVKPPLIFIVAAVSLITTAGRTLYTILLLLLLSLVAPTTAFACSKMLKKSPLRIRKTAVLLSLLAGLTIGVRTLHASQGLEPEGFALLFAVLPMLCMGLGRDRRSTMALDSIAGISLGIATMFKEPFGISGLVAMLVFVESKRDWTRLFRVCIVSALTCLSLLVMTGTAVEYFTIYLPEVIFGRGLHAFYHLDPRWNRGYFIPTPVWIRAFDTFHFFRSLAAPNHPAFFSLFTFLALGIWTLMRARTWKKRHMLAWFIFAMGTLTLMTMLFQLQQELASPEKFRVYDALWEGSAPIARSVTLTASSIILAMTLFISLRRLHMPFRLLLYGSLGLLGLYSVGTLASFTAVFHPESYYLTLAFSPLLALAMSVMVKMGRTKHAMLILVIIGIPLILNAGTPREYDYHTFTASFHDSVQAYLKQQPGAAALDAIMEQCGIERYFVSTDNLIAMTGQTTHSPYQIFYAINRSIGGFVPESAEQHPNPFFARKMREDLERTDIIVLNSATRINQLPRVVVRALRRKFTTIAPACARLSEPLPGVLRIYFRKGGITRVATDRSS